MAAEPLQETLVKSLINDGPVACSNLPEAIIIKPLNRDWDPALFNYVPDFIENLFEISDMFKNESGLERNYILRHICF